MKAFPTIKEYDNHGRLINSDGMDLRDYFAANAPINFETLDEYWGIHWKLCDNLDANDYLAKARYEYADAMMKARKQ
jgi:hypothetical protein